MPGQRLSELTTLGVGGPADEVVEAHDVGQLAHELQRAEALGQAVLVLGGGSNVVVADEGFAGTVVRIASKGVQFGYGGQVANPGRGDGDGLGNRAGQSVTVTVAAGEDWSALVARCVGEGLAGIECLSGIPGLAGATPVQNVGAYGQEVSSVISRVAVWDRAQHRLQALSQAECRFGYRDSLFKRSTRYVVTEVEIVLQRLGGSGGPGLSQPVRYAELARELGTEVGAQAGLDAVAAAVIGLRRSKGMVLDATDPDTLSAGSFFMNPVLTGAQLSQLQQVAPQVPMWPTSQGTKVAAAWLVDMSGFHRGYRRGTAAISSKHTLALTVRPGGTAADLLALAREVREGVRDKFGVVLQPEPLLVGAHL